MRPSSASQQDTPFIAHANFQDADQGLDATVYLHPASGARILDVQSEDNENLLSVLFRTPPTDDTGLPHILEHAVLGGSRKYPVKDPFFHMLKMSLATFLNAMTGPDYTIYPCASNVAADFFNLADVYLDAVFHPLLDPTHFGQEGYHLAFDPPDAENGRLIVKGIVFNEMRGAYSSANERMQRAIERGLFPNAIYRFDAGGDPDRILDLQYEDFVGFHRRHYHPSNALIVHYGNIPPESWMPFLNTRLSGFPPAKAAPAPAPQPLWTEPRSITDRYPIGEGDATRERTYLGMSWLTLQHPPPLEQMAQEALFLILTGHDGAPLRRALIDSNLGHDLTHTYTHAFGRELTFHVGIKGSEPERCAAFEQLVMATLSSLAKPGAIGSQSIETALTRLGYHFQEINDGFPLKLASQIYRSWAIGDDPFAWLNGRAVLNALRRQIENDPDFFGRRIRAWFLENAHRLTTVLRPDPQLGARQEAAIDAALQDRRKRMTAADRQRVQRDAGRLAAFQQKRESAEAIDRLPRLQIRDLPKHPPLIPTTLDASSDHLTVLRQDLATNGVNYLALSMDVSSFSADALRLAQTIFTHVATRMGAAGMDYATIAERISAHTGGMHYELLPTTCSLDPDRQILRMVLRTKFLDVQTDAALTLLHDLLFAPEFHDSDRLMNLLIQRREQHHSHVVENALSYAMPLAARHTSRFNGLLNHISGLAELRQADSWHERFGADRSTLPQRLQTLSAHLTGCGPWIASFTGSDRAYDRFRAAWRDWAPRVQPSGNTADPRPDSATKAPAFDALTPPRQGLAAPMDVAFNVMGLPLPHDSEADAALIEIGMHLLSFDYLLDEIRFKGSAYGGGCAYRPERGVAFLYSYRDPEIARTLKVYQGLPDVIQAVEWRQTDIDRGIFGVARNNLRPIRPASATRIALLRHLRQVSDEAFQAYHERLLRATPETVKRALTDHLDAGLARAGLCIVANRDRLTRFAATCDEWPLEIENILKAT